MKDVNPLGQSTAYPDQYDASLLFPIDRKTARESIGIDSDLPFAGVDRWTAYEVSWLNSKGKPQMRMAECLIDASSPHIIESKSFKLYLNSLNQAHFPDEDAVKQTLVSDLSAACGAPVSVTLFHLESDTLGISSALPGQCLDDLDIAIEHYSPSTHLLTVDNSRFVEQSIAYSHLLKTNCPVTDQPDWASVFIEYTGAEINLESLLAYIISFRQHQGFHENCVEHIFQDINRCCSPTQLAVYARYTRRGGLDINPFRSNFDTGSTRLENNLLRIARQ